MTQDGGNFGVGEIWSNRLMFEEPTTSKDEVEID